MKGFGLLSYSIVARLSLPCYTIMLVLFVFNMDLCYRCHLCYMFNLCSVVSRRGGEERASPGDAYGGEG